MIFNQMNKCSLFDFHVFLLFEGCSWRSAQLSVLVPLVGLVSQSVSEVLVGEEGPGQLIDAVVGADGPEVFNVVPEVRGGVGPVGDRWRFIIRNYNTRIHRCFCFCHHYNNKNERKPH